MRAAGASVPEAVRELITRSRSVYDCMKMDVINYTALAVRLQPEVERHVGGPVNLNTIVVAIKRYADSFDRDAQAEEEPVLKDARLSLTDGMLDARFAAGDADAASLLDKFSQIGADVEFFKLAGSLRILAEDMAPVRELFDSFPGQGFSSGLAKIRILMPAGQSRSDAVSYVAEVLHGRGIELANAYFSSDSIVIILDEQDASRAYEILRAEIGRGG